MGVFSIISWYTWLTLAIALVATFYMFAAHQPLYSWVSDKYGSKMGNRFLMWEGFVLDLLLSISFVVTYYNIKTVIN